MSAATTGFSAVFTAGVGLMLMLGHWGTGARGGASGARTSSAPTSGPPACWSDFPKSGPSSRRLTAGTSSRRCGSSFSCICAAIANTCRCRRGWRMTSGTSSFCTRASTAISAAARSGNSCTTCRRRRCRRCASSPMSGCAAHGGGLAVTKASIPAGPIACRCCSPSTGSSPFRTVFLLAGLRQAAGRRRDNAVRRRFFQPPHRWLYRGLWPPSQRGGRLRWRLRRRLSRPSAISGQPSASARTHPRSTRAACRSARCRRSRAPVPPARRV